MHTPKIQSVVTVVAACFFAFAAGVQAQCAAGQIDLLEYMGPENGQSYDLRYCGPAGSGSEPIQVNRDTILTVEGPKPGFYLNKGGNYEAYFYDNQNIYLYEDTSWDETCPNGEEAFYRVFRPGGAAGGPIQRCVNIGTAMSSQQYVVGYSEAGYNRGDAGTVCNNGYQPTTVSQIVQSGANNPYSPTIPGSLPEDTIVLTNASGAGAGESKYYTKGYGLTAFRAVDASGNVFFWSSFYKDGVSTSEPNLQCSDSDVETMTGYDTSGFPEYTATEDTYYLHPISGMLSPGRSVEKIRKDLALSGYEAYCAADNVKIKPEINTAELVRRYLELNPGGINLLGESVETLDVSTAQFPIWRELDAKKFLTTSIEEYFSFKDVYTQIPSTAELNSAPINSLLSVEQRCVQSAKVLLATELMCEKLLNPGECAPLAQPVPGTNYSVDSLRADLHDFIPKYRDGGIGEGCRELYEDQDTALEFKKGLQNMPLEINTAYRFAFLVAAIEMKPPGNSSVATSIFNFFTGRTEDQQPKHEVLVTAFKVPDIATNKGGGDDSGSQYWNDPSYLTRNVLIPRKRVAEIEDVERPARRQQILDAAVSAAVQNDGSKIYCYDGTFPGGIGVEACENEVGKAVVDLINGSAQGCSERIEPVMQLFSAAGFGDVLDPYGRFYINEWGQQILLNMFGAGSYPDRTHVVDNNYMDPQKAKIDTPWYEKIKSRWTINSNTWPAATNETKVSFYLVYPFGYEIDQIENVLKNTFFTKDQLATLETDPAIKDRFPLKGDRSGLSGGGVSWDFVDPEETCDNGTATPGPCTKSVDITLSQESAEYGVYGARLGYWLRQIQKSLNSSVSSTQNYLSNCQSLEQFFTGRCGKGSSGSGTGTGPGTGTGTGNNLVAVAQCLPNSPRITSGETATHIYTDATNTCTTFVSNIHNIPEWKNPNDPAKDCANLYSYVACTYPNTLIQNGVSSSGQFNTTSSTTACEYVVAQARAAGISPRFALAMWGEESGFSSYRVPDFGVISQPAQDMGAQVGSFVRTANSYSTLINFLEAYSGEVRGSNVFCNNPAFVGRLKTFYDFLGP